MKNCGMENVYTVSTWPSQYCGPQLTGNISMPHYNKHTKKILVLRTLTKMAYVEWNIGTQYSE